MRIVVAMSGGVDSSVAAALLADQGHDVIGLSMQLYDQSSEHSFGSCCSIEDLHDARRVASASSSARSITLIWRISKPTSNTRRSYKKSPAEAPTMTRA